MPRRPHLTHHRRRPLPVVVAGVAVCTLVSLLDGCGGEQVSVEAYDVPQDARAACRDLVADLPERVADQPRSEVDGSSYAAAWSDRVVLRCGVPTPADFTDTSSCSVADGIGWFVPPDQADDQVSDVVMTTVHRSPAVEVRLDAALRPPTAAMVDLAAAIDKHTTARGSCR